MNTFDQFSTRRDVEMLFMESRLTGEEESVSSVSLFIRTGFSLTMVKVNPKRKVFRLTNDSGRELYLKLFAPRKFPLNFLRNAAAKEYTIAKELEKASISVIRYLLWGKGRNNCTFTVSEGVKEPVSAREFFFFSQLFHTQSGVYRSAGGTFPACGTGSSRGVAEKEKFCRCPQC